MGCASFLHTSVFNSDTAGGNEDGSDARCTTHCMMPEWCTDQRRIVKLFLVLPDRRTDLRP